MNKLNLNTIRRLAAGLHSALVFSMLAFIISTGIAACGKKSVEDDKLVVGSLSTDGKAVTSNISLGGYPMSLIVQNIQPASAGSISMGMAFSTLNFEVSVNGQNRALQSALALKTSGNFGNRTAVKIGGFQVLYQAACYSADCADIAVEVIVASAYDYRQIVLHKDMRQNKIVQMGEWQVGWSTIRPLSEIMNEI